MTKTETGFEGSERRITASQNEAVMQAFCQPAASGGAEELKSARSAK